jgi:hypothetical protein
MSTATLERNGPAIFAIGEDGQRLFVRLRSSCIPPPWVPEDGMPAVHFDEEDTPYLAVEEVLAWFERESEACPADERYRAAVAAYRRVLEKFAAGEIEEG